MESSQLSGPFTERRADLIRLSQPRVRIVSLLGITDPSDIGTSSRSLPQNLPWPEYAGDDIISERNQYTAVSISESGTGSWGRSMISERDEKELWARARPFRGRGRPGEAEPIYPDLTHLWLDSYANRLSKM
jgi:hypothetical protein